MYARLWLSCVYLHVRTLIYTKTPSTIVKKWLSSPRTSIMTSEVSLYTTNFLREIIPYDEVNLSFEEVFLHYCCRSLLLIPPPYNKLTPFCWGNSRTYYYYAYYPLHATARKKTFSKFGECVGRDAIYFFFYLISNKEITKSTLVLFSSVSRIVGFDYTDM